MLKSIKFGLILGAVLLVAGAVATSAAFVTVTIDRPASATLTADNAANAAVKILCLDNTAGGGVNYSALCTYDTAGSVSMALEKALKADGSISFNRNATFSVGSNAANSQVLSITNNSQDPIHVYFNNTSANGTMTMYSAAGTALTSAAAPTPVSDTVASGATGTYYFVLQTPQNTNDTQLTGTLQIR